MILFEILASILALAGVGYFIAALINPERFS